MIVLYRLQQKIGITKIETVTLFSVLAMFLMGLIVQHYQVTSATFDEAHYQKLEDVFENKTEALQTQYQRTFASFSDSTSNTTNTTNTPNTSQAPATTSSVSTSKKMPPARMNLNTANERLLQRLPGVGPSTATKILEYRQSVASFNRVEDIMKVKGIGPKKFEKMQPYIFVENATASE